ncbi:hypothetical protein [Nocardia rhizosphaerae]|uniref:Uncharacterized protein n=1 Tax=Nocardia rhizosphaerae TaxID=1691571 RepID=A0ABV8KYV5_9NOCA
MSESASLACSECRVQIDLGKAVKDLSRVRYFHSGDSDKKRNPDNGLISAVLWKFLAEHGYHGVRVYSDYDAKYDDEVAGYEEIGGDGIGEVSLRDYVANWSGWSLG